MTPTKEQAQAALEKFKRMVNNWCESPRKAVVCRETQQTIIAALEAVCEDGKEYMIGVVVGHESFSEREAVPYYDMGHSLKSAIATAIYGSQEEAYANKGSGEEIDEIFQVLKQGEQYDFEAGCIFTVPLRKPFPKPPEGQSDASPVG